MKIFWSWQSDTPGKIGRHFVRDSLSEAIEVLKQSDEIEEPSEREQREALHLDHDRKGVPGSPDLALTILKKIDQAAVFVADVTIVGETRSVGGRADEQRPKGLINSNVAIEYGYAQRVLGDERILMVQNRHFGERNDLPFDLRHKAGPLQYLLAPGASGQQIDAERARLRGELVSALRPYLGMVIAQKVVFQEVQATLNPSIFFEPSEVLARVGVAREDEIEYRFSEPRVFYLRLIPTRRREHDLRFGELYELAQQRRLDLLLREAYASLPGRNRFGAIAFEPRGSSTTLQSFTQAFNSGELWGVTTEFFAHYENKLVVPTVNVQNIFSRVLANYCSVAKDDFGLDPPYRVELGAIGLDGVSLGINRNRMSARIYKDQLMTRRILNDVSVGAQQILIGSFLDALFDLAGEDWRAHMSAT